MPRKPDLWRLVHREYGPIQTFLTREEADREFEDVLRDKSDWAGKLSVEPFSFRQDLAREQLLPAAEVLVRWAERR